jgi:hypothetical protein
MRLFLPTRVVLLSTTLTGLVLGGAVKGTLAQARRGRSAAPAYHAAVPRMQAAPQQRFQPVTPGPAGRGVKGDHLADWMNKHSNLTPAQQQQALEREPGFSEYPAQTQQRLRDRLTQLNAMNPQQRERLLARNEAMEHLTPDQRAQVRGAMQQLGSLPPDQRRVVARSFRELRDLPPEQRFAAMNSDRYRSQLNDSQRATLGNLLRIEPMLPPPDAPGPR